MMEYNIRTHVQILPQGDTSRFGKERIFMVLHLHDMLCAVFVLRSLLIMGALFCRWVHSQEAGIHTAASGSFSVKAIDSCHHGEYINSTVVL